MEMLLLLIHQMVKMKWIRSTSEHFYHLCALMCSFLAFL